MKKQARDTSKRRERIMRLLHEQGSVQVNALAETFSVSPQTIRQDLGFLQKLNMAARSYGGAVLHQPQGTAPEAALGQKRRLFQPEKTAIGARAAALLRPGDTVILDSGTTTLQIAVHIPAGLELTVLTNDLAIANEVSRHRQVDLVMLGGNLRRKNMSLYGLPAERAVRELSVDKFFLGVDGIDLQRGITTHFEAEAILNRLMCESAKEVIAVTDSSKFGRVCMHRIVEAAGIHRLITDDRLARDPRAALLALGVAVDCVETPGSRESAARGR